MISDLRIMIVETTLRDGRTHFYKQNHSAAMWILGAPSECIAMRCDTLR